MDPAVQTPFSGGSHRRRLPILVASIVLLGVAYLTIGANPRDAANGALLSDLFKPKSLPPARMMVCEGALDAPCAQDAADQAFTFLCSMSPRVSSSLGSSRRAFPRTPEGPREPASTSSVQMGDG